MPVSSEATARLAEVEDGERRTQLIVDAVEDHAQRLRELKESFMRMGLKQEIEPNLGTVVVNGNGDLLSIKFDDAALRASDLGSLGARIVAAIKTAEARTAAFRDRKYREVLDSRHL